METTSCEELGHEWVTVWNDYYSSCQECTVCGEEIVRQK